MDKQSIPNRGMKRRRSNIRQNRRLPSKKVVIPDDSWLESLKFLTCSQWSTMRYISRHVNRVAESNISRLPRGIIESVTIYKNLPETNESKKVLEELQFNAETTIAFDTIIPSNERWFKDRTYTVEAPADVSPDKAFMWSSWLFNNSMKFPQNNPTRNRDATIHMCILGYSKEEVPLSNKETYYPWFNGEYGNLEELRKPVLFYAQFNPLLNPYSWASLEQFLKLIYHPSSYVKEIAMYAVNPEIIRSLSAGETCYIRCESFTLKGVYAKRKANTALPDALKWMERNVRAESIYFYDEFFLMRNEIFSLYQDDERIGMLVEFLFGGSRFCASQKVKLYMEMQFPTGFLYALIKEFRQLTLIENSTPTIMVYGYIEDDFELCSDVLGPNLIDKEVDSEGATSLYMVHNGQNRMRISFSNKHFQTRVKFFAI